VDDVAAADDAELAFIFGHELAHNILDHGRYLDRRSVARRWVGSLGAVPWAVLSAGVDHAHFLPQIETAMANGASGVIGGRALWKDCISLDETVMQERLTTIALPRLREIQALLARFAR
jgi:tagatose-1,6-bisphosphate aldolase